MSNPVKSVWYIMCYSSSSNSHLKSPQNSIITVKWAAPETITQNQKDDILEMISKSSNSSVSTILVTARTRHITVFFSHIYLHITLKHRYHRWDFPQSGKQDSLRNKLEMSVNMLLWKSRLTFLQNHHWGAIRTRDLGEVKISSDLLNPLGV